MLCPNCGYHPSPSDKFCMECGAPKARFVDDSIPSAPITSPSPPDPPSEVQQPVVAPPMAAPVQQPPKAPPEPIPQPTPPQSPPSLPVEQRPVDRPPQPQGPPIYAPPQYQASYQQPYPPTRPAAPPQYQQPLPPQAQPLPQMIPYQRSSNEMTPQGNGQIGQYQVYVPPKAPKVDIQLPPTPAAPAPAPQPYPPYSQPQPAQAPPAPQPPMAPPQYQPAPVPPNAPPQPGPWTGQQPPAQPYQPTQQPPVPNTYRPYPPPAQQPPVQAPQPQYQQPYQPAPVAPQPYGQPMGAPGGMMLMPQVASAAMLRPNERTMQVWRAGLEKDSYDPEENEHGTFNLNGVLIATDQRLIFVQEKGVFGKSYKPLESIEYREIANWRLGQTMRIRSLQVDVTQGRGRSKVFNNLSEVDPATLNVVAPWTLDQVKELLGRLKGAAP